MPSILPGYEYDIFISYRHNDNINGGVTEFVEHLRNELAATLKDSVSIYFDSNAHDGLLENHNVDKSLEGKLKCLIFIPIISQTYCDSKSFAWQHEFVAFNKMAQQDQFGRDIMLSSGNVASRILPVQIHKLDTEDTQFIEKELGGVLRSIEFIYEEAGVNRPLKKGDSETKNVNGTRYENQVNKVANAIKEIITALKKPAQVKKMSKPDSPSFHGKGLKGRGLYAILALVVTLLLAGYFLYPFDGTEELEEEVLDKSIAVLPFENFISGSENDYFGDGLTEEILNVLAKTPDLNVASRTSSFQYKGKQEDARKIARDLGVAHILEGSVRGSDKRLRITAQLIRASDGFHLWSETYDKTKDDVIQVQEDIAIKIAQALKTVMDPEALEEMAKSGTQNIEAYNNYLKGLAINSNDPLKAYHNFEKARALDSTFVSAHFRAAFFWRHQLEITRQRSDLTQKTYEEKINLFRERIALAIRYADPIERLKYQGYIAYINLQLRDSYQFFEAYLKERPNDWNVLQTKFTISLYLNERTDIISDFETMENNALENSDHYTSLANYYFHAGFIKKGAAFGKKAIARFPNSKGLLYQVHRLYLWDDQIEEARTVMNTYLTLVDVEDYSIIVRMRQACAEGDSLLAYTLNNEVQSMEKNRFIRKWLFMKYLNKNVEAEQLLVELDKNEQMFSLSSWLHYSFFDPSPYPELQKILEREEAVPRTPTIIPVTLKSSVKF